MSLIRRGQVWWVDVTDNGKRIRQSIGECDKKNAQRIYNKIIGEIAEGKWFERLPGRDISFREMITKYMTDYSAKEKAIKSHIRDRSLSNHLLERFGDLTLTEVKPKLISEYKLVRRAEGAAAKTVNLELALMRHAFNLAIKEWEWVKENPVCMVSGEKVNNLIERWLTFEEEERLLAHCPKWLGEVLSFGIETGLRQDELLSLKWSQVDLARRTLSILEQKNKGKDTLPLNERALEILKARARVRHIQSKCVFCNQKWNKMEARNLLRAFYSATARADIKNLRWHDATRHTFATRLVQGGVDIYTVQKLGRWRNINMVMRYAHHYSESLRPGVEVLDRQRKIYDTNRTQSQ